jgi:hypothetical protein
MKGTRQEPALIDKTEIYRYGIQSVTAGSAYKLTRHNHQTNYEQIMASHQIIYSEIVIELLSKYDKILR